MRLLLTIVALTRASVVDILSRDQPKGELLVAFPIATDDGRQLGDLEFYEKDAAVDTVAAYCAKNKLPSWFRKMLAAKVCERTLEADKSLLRSYRSAGARARCTTQKASRRQIKIDLIQVSWRSGRTKILPKPSSTSCCKRRRKYFKNRTKWDAQHERWEKNRR